MRRALAWDGTWAVPFPAGAHALHVGERHGVLHVWALADDESPEEPMRFAVVEDGAVPPEGEWQHVGTVLAHVVRHVFVRVTEVH